jgi:tRNA pseudouridine38-40 synthase
MKRIRLTIAYDGTDYAGFQIQPGSRTIEGELDRALSELTGEEITVIGASRTDSGVHALGNIAVFDTESPIPADRYALALIPYLPQDIRVTASEEVEAGWHPRHCASRKTYEYVFQCGPVEDPLTRRFGSYIRRVPDIEAMQKAATYLVGEHDFTSFANPSSQVLMQGGSAVRTVYAVTVTKEDPAHRLSPGSCMVRIRITGSGFLYNMVRIIAGTLLQAGTGLWSPERVKEALEARDRTKAGPTAEARGLTLVGIEYL